MSDYILMMTGTHKNWTAMTANEKEMIMEKYYSFVNRLKNENRFKGGSALNHAGVLLRSESGKILIDGPYAETKETLNGYMIFSADNMDEAVFIARSCPALTHGETVEVFELTDH